MNTLENLLNAQSEYKKLLRIERQLVKNAVQNYQIDELVKQCSEAKHARNQQLLGIVQTQLMGTCALVGTMMIPYLTMMAF